MKDRFLRRIFIQRKINSQKKKEELLIKLKKAIDILTKEFHPEKIMLIGSFVAGRLHSFSDIDLVVKGLGEDYLKAGGRLLDTLGECIDIKAWELLDKGFKKKVLKEGKVIYGRSLTGFTLLEAIIVVVISGIVATLGIPIYARIVEKNRSEEAIANLKLIRAAERIYRTQNYNIYYPFPTPNTIIANNQIAVDANINAPLGLDIDYRNYSFNITTASNTAFTVSATRTGGAYADNCIQINEAGVWQSCGTGWPYPFPPPD